MFYEAGLMLEQYLFIGLFIGGLFGLVLTFTRRGKKTFGLELAIAFVLFAAGVFGPTLLSFPPTPYILFPSLSYTTATDGTFSVKVSSPGGIVSTLTRPISPAGSGAAPGGPSTGGGLIAVASDAPAQVVTSDASVKVVDVGSSVPVTGTVITATDDNTGVSVSVKTDSQGIVPVETIVSDLTEKIAKKEKEEKEEQGVSPEPTAVATASATPSVDATAVPSVSVEPTAVPSVEPTAVPSATPEAEVVEDITLVTKTAGEETTKKITIDNGDPRASGQVDVRIDVLPALSVSFVQQDGGIESVSAESGTVFSSSPVLIPITPSDVMTPPGLSAGREGGRQLEFQRELKTVDVVVNGRDQRLSTIELRIKNRGNLRMENLAVHENLRVIFDRIREDRRKKGLTIEKVEEKITLVGASAEPVELKSGEFAKWLFTSIEPGDDARVSYTVDTAVDENVVEMLPAPVAVAVSNEPLKVVVKQQSSFDTTAVIGLILASAIVCAIAVFFVRRPEH